jgi:hypothetical protein
MGKTYHEVLGRREKRKPILTEHACTLILKISGADSPGLLHRPLGMERFLYAR